VNSVLIINLLRYGDIYASAYLVDSIKSKYPNCKISMLVYSEFQAAAKSIKGISTTYAIDRKKILSITGNKLFSDGMALDAFSCVIDEIKEAKWETVVNYSNDVTSAYLTAYLSKDKYCGVKYSQANTTQFSSDWAILFNDVLTEFKYSNLHHIDCYHKICNIEGQKNVSAGIIKTNLKHNETSQQAFDSVRKKYSKNSDPIQLVGIQLFTSDEKKNIPYDTIVELIDKIYASESMVPVLLVSQQKSESQIADSMNALFNNALIIVESDLVALPSVISNLDAIVTPDTVTKHLADLLGIPTVEVALGSAPFRKQGGYNLNNIVLAPTISCYPCSAKSECSCDTKHLCQQKIKASDIFMSIKCLFTPRMMQQAAPSSEVCLYVPKKDNLGVYYTPAVGHVNFHDLLSFNMFREYIKALTNKTLVITIPIQAHKNVPYATIIDWMAKEKEACTEISRALLGTIRSLTKVSAKSSDNVQEFIVSLDKLLSFCQTEELASIPLHILRAKMESAENDSFTDNYKTAETLLYEVKNSLQTLVSCLNALDMQTKQKQQEDAVFKVKSQKTTTHQQPSTQASNI